jgi:DNA-binding transcriptional MerR regulator
MAEYRIDELARLAATTVRNIRVYQDRGLLDPPRRAGRVGIYSDAHLARLRLISQLLKRGYTFANIGELLAVWGRGGDLGEILDLESAIGHPWSDEMSDYATAGELEEMFGADFTPENLSLAIGLGLLEPDGARFRVPSRRLLNAGRELTSVGMPLRAVLDLAGKVRMHVDAAASQLASTVTGHVLSDHLRDGILQGPDVAEVAAITRRLRPLAQVAVDAMLGQAMSRYVQEALGDHFAEVMEHLQQARSGESG